MCIIHLNIHIYKIYVCMIVYELGTAISEACVTGDGKLF